MSQIEDISQALRALAKRSEGIGASLAEAASVHRGLSTRLAALRGTGVDTGRLVGAVEEAMRLAERASASADRVATQGAGWADELARGGATSGASHGASAAAGASPDSMEPVSVGFTTYATEPEEFQRQLANQEKGMRELTIAEFISNRDAYILQGRAKEGSVAQDAARQVARQAKIKELVAGGMKRRDAVTKTEEWLATQAALHDPDQVAGGFPDRVHGMGSAAVNSSLGSQWRTRIDALDAAARDFAKRFPDAIRKVKLNVRLFS